MSYDYKAISEATEVATFGNDDRVLIVTADGLRQTTRQAVVGVIGGADIKDWDARASRANVTAYALPMRRTHVLPDAVAAVTSIPTMDGTNTIVTKKKTSEAGGQKAYWTLRGSVPDTGSHWIGFEAQCSDASTIHRIYIGRQTIHELAGVEVGDTVGYIEITGGQIKAKRRDTGAESSVSVVNANQKVLVQISPTNITVYASGGFVFSFGTRPSEDLLIGGQIVCTADVAQTLTINATNSATLPRSPDAGFNALQMLDSVLPADTYATDILYVRTGSVFRDVLLKADGFYMLAANDETIAMLDASQVATIANENIFQKPVGVNNDFVLHAKPDVYADNLSYFGPRNSNLYDGMLGVDVLEAGAFFGDSFQSHNGRTSYNLYSFGQVFNNLGTGATATEDIYNLLGMGYGLNHTTLPCWDTVYISPYGGAGVLGVQDSVLIGHHVANSSGGLIDSSVFIGSLAGSIKSGGATPSTGNTAVGYGAFSGGKLVGSQFNTAMGYNAASTGDATAEAMSNVAIGDNAMYAYEGVMAGCTAVGSGALYNSNGAQEIVAVGQNAADSLTGINSVAIGAYALGSSVGAINNCTAVGRHAMMGLGATTNSSALGNNATVTGSNQVQLGDSATTTYAYGSVQSRSDIRDKTGIRKTELGLAFILALRPVDYRWDYREDYVSYAERPVEPPALYDEPKMDESIAKDDPRYDSFYTAYLTSHQAWVQAREFRVQQMEHYRREYADWLESQDLTNVVKDGSKTRSRFHHGFIAQEVKAVADKQGVDFGGYQDHALAGGKDVKSLGYEEFISPIVSAIQELDAKITSADMIDQIADRVLEKIAGDSDSPLLDIIAEKMLAKLAAARRG